MLRRALLAGGAALLLIATISVVRTGIRALGLPAYWQGRMDEQIPHDGFRLVALGDSAIMAVGADDPMEGIVGRIANHVQAATGRPVHIANVSTGGTIADVLLHQLPQVDLTTADLVVVANSNDLESGLSLADYRNVLAQLMDALPADRTVYSDLPFLPGREPYQQVLAEVANAHGILRADFASVFNNQGRRLDIFSWLPPHLNSKGYGYWFEAFRPEVDRVLERSDGRRGWVLARPTGAERADAIDIRVPIDGIAVD
jgi:lysophospholipase L1-like esterase